MARVKLRCIMGWSGLKKSFQEKSLSRKSPKKTEEKIIVIDSDKIPITTDQRSLGTWFFQEMFINI